VALVAFDAVIRTVGPAGVRSIPADDFFLLPGDTPHRERPLVHGELIVGIDVPGAPIARRSTYLKLRDRQSYEFALVSVAAAIDVADGLVTDVRLAFGGVATKPWRARRAEAALVGTPPGDAAFRRATAAELEDAVLREHNHFKVELTQRAAVRSLARALAGTQ
jgi:xanthine dehydrogenase YagS FAD-binding subunit